MVIRSCAVLTLMCFLAFGLGARAADQPATETVAQATQPTSRTIVVQSGNGPATVTTVKEAPVKPGTPPTKPGVRPTGPTTKPTHTPPKPGQPSKPGSSPPKKPGSETTPPAKEVARPAEPNEPADPAEFEVRPDSHGLVQFQFQGQRWPDVLEWLGQISGLSVDWQKLPGDYINVSTQRGYTVAEVRDVLNRLLLARGYTILQQEAALIVIKCDELNAAMVPRATASQLEELPAHDFVRAQFPLQRLMAQDLAEELKPLLSKNGKLSAMKATNRIEVMDAAVNVREIKRLLDEEDGRESTAARSVREFVLKYARADDVKESLEQFLGLSSATKTSSRSMTPQQMAQQQAMMRAQMAAAQRSSSSQKRPTVTMPPKVEPPRLMVNRSRNSVLVKASPDKMAIVAEAVELLDVPPDGAQSLQAIVGRMKVYRLAQLDPRALVETLNDVGGLDPTTRLEPDEDNKAIIAYATPADHFTIQAMIDKLDSSARKIEVIPLRHLAADEVAGTIQYLMVGQRDEKKSSRSSYYGGYYPYDYGRRSSSQSSNDTFRVDADVENNRLLVRANDVELEEVVSILVKLGEIPQPGSQSAGPRILDVVPGDQAAEFFQKLQTRWQQVAPNPLVLPEVDVDKEEAPPAPETKDDKSATETATPTGQEPRDSVVKLTAAPARPPGTQDAAAPPPVVISINRDGQLVVSCKDAAALELFEEIASQLAPPVKDFKVYHLEYASATWVALNLEDFFKEDGDEDSESSRFFSYMYGMPSANSESPSRRLSKRRKVTFISDIDTNTVLVKNADAGQLRTIDELIKIYDEPAPLGSQTARITRLFPVQYSKATIIAETIKDAFRDLLSSNDKAFRQSGTKQQTQRYASGVTVLSPFGASGQDRNRESPKVRFKGKLSIGIDEVSNTLLVSTDGEALMQVIEQMITELDRAALPASEMRVLKVGTGTDWSRLQETIAKVIGQQQRSSTQRSSTSKPPTSTARPSSSKSRSSRATPSRR